MSRSPAMGKRPFPVEPLLFAVAFALIWFSLLFSLELGALCVYVSLWAAPMEILNTAVRLFPPYVFAGWVAGLFWGTLFLALSRFRNRPPPDRKQPIFRYGLCHLAVLLMGLLFLDSQLLLPEWKLAGLYLITACIVYALYRLGRFLLGRFLPGPAVRGVPVKRWAAVVGTLTFLAVGVHLFSLTSETGCQDPPPRSRGLPAEGQRPNIVLIVWDTVRPDHLSCYGYLRDTTPFLQSMAQEGVVFDHVISTSPWTLPSHASIFSGLYPSQHGATHAHLKFSDDVDSLPEILSDAGYQTVGFSANPWVGRSTGMQRGFGLFGEVWRELVADNFFSLIRIYHSMARIGPDQGAERILDRAAAWVKTCYDPARPVFFFANFMDAHSPYSMTPAEYRRKYLAAGIKEERVRRLDRERLLHLYGKRTLGPEEFQILEGLYDGGIHYLDTKLAALEAILTDKGPAGDRETLWVITSDHGENFGEHGLVDHEYAVNEALIRVALILRFPGRLPAGSRCATRVQNLDLFATLLDAAGILDFDRKESLGLIPPPQGGPRRPFEVAEYFRPELCLKMARRQGHDPSRYDRSLRTVRKAGWKYVQASDGADELYDLDRDPHEEANLIDERPEQVALLRQDLERWLARTAVEQPKEGKGDIDVDPVLEERLKSLGYTE